ncbi:hypothetical protein E1508_02340 [Pseudomonas moraviensis]|nr:hypothetical protein E1508_02340 [Pseudomonas moraviensis]
MITRLASSLVVTGLASSRAGSLPQWSCVVYEIPVGASLLANAAPPIYRLNPPSRGMIFPVI